MGLIHFQYICSNFNSIRARPTVQLITLLVIQSAQAYVAYLYYNALIKLWCSIVHMTNSYWSEIWENTKNVNEIHDESFRSSACGLHIRVTCLEQQNPGHRIRTPSTYRLCFLWDLTWWPCKAPHQPKLETLASLGAGSEAKYKFRLEFYQWHECRLQIPDGML